MQMGINSVKSMKEIGGNKTKVTNTDTRILYFQIKQICDSAHCVNAML